MIIIIVYNVIHHVKHAQIHQIYDVIVALQIVYILITMHNCNHVRYNVQMAIIKVTNIVCPVINRV